jgi:hypothetical protein
MPRVPIHIAPNGPTGYTVAIDGVDLSHWVEGISLTIDARNRLLPQLALSMSHLTLRTTRNASITAEADAEIIIPDELDAVLRKLGWTPPAANSATIEGK